jgi:hypothetical protein
MSWRYFWRSPFGALLPLALIGLSASWIIPRCSPLGDAPPPAPEQPGHILLPPPLAPHSPARPALAPVPPSPSLPRSPLADTLNSPATTARDDLVTLGRILALYRERFDAYPAFETNVQLVNALAGANPLSIALLPRDAPAIAPATGQLLDRWGTPYEIHAISRDALELRSAGPDRTLRTPDDLTLPLGAAAAPTP